MRAAMRAPLLLALASVASVQERELPALALGERELTVLAEEGHLTAWQELEALAREFEAEYPGLTVRCLPLGGAAGAQDKAKFLIAGGVPLDLLRIDVTELAAYAAEGALLDLRPYLAAEPSFEEDAYFPQVLAALRGAEGELYGLPSTFTPYVMYVNLDRLAELGLARPEPGWTWDDFLALARRATEDTDGDGRTDRFGVSLTQWLQAVIPWRARRRARRAGAHARARVRRGDALPARAPAQRARRVVRRELREPAHAGPVPGRARTLLRTGRVLGDVPLPRHRHVPLGRPAAAAREARGDLGRDDGLRRAAHGARARARGRAPPAHGRSRVPAHARPHRERRAGAHRGGALGRLPEARRRARERARLPRRPRRGARAAGARERGELALDRGARAGGARGDPARARDRRRGRVLAHVGEDGRIPGARARERGFHPERSSSP
jgi:hypothetical protein